MKRPFVVIAALCFAIGGAQFARAQEGLGKEELSNLSLQQRILDNVEQTLSQIEAARRDGDCERMRQRSGELDLFFAVMPFSPAAGVLRDDQVASLRARLAEVSRRPCEPRDAPVESVVDDLPPAVSDLTRFDPNNIIVQLRSIHEACVKGDVPEGAERLYQERYDRFQAEIRAARDVFRRAAIGAEPATREILIERMRSYEAALEGMPEDFWCRPRMAEVREDDRSPIGGDAPPTTEPDPRAGARFDTPAEDGASAGAAGGDLDWLLGTWVAPRGGAIGFRRESDGTATAYVAELNDRMRENGYSMGQVFLRGCRDVTSRNLAVWVHSARCEESFRERWEGESVIMIPRGKETLDLGGYYGGPLVGYSELSRSGR